MKTKKRPTKRRKKAMVSLVTGATISTSMPGQIYYYPTLPPRKTTWITKIKEYLASLWDLI